MITLDSGSALSITLAEDTQGRDQVVLSLPDLEGVLGLTPHQARVLATELIMAVNRAEVRNNLRHSPKSMVRSTQETPQKRGLFSQAFAK